MKSMNRILWLALLLNAGAWTVPQQASAQHIAVSFQIFYDELSPYGAWVEYPPHGYVWMPNEGPEFIPYATAGHWVYTAEGWTWVSDYPWGWATFHYGRWLYDDEYGWLWVPGEEWGPAWVVWRRSPGYYGWVPLRPGISVSVALGGGYHERDERWIFVKDVDFGRPDIGHHYVNATGVPSIIKKSTVVGNNKKAPNKNVTYIVGPDKSDVQKTTHVEIKTVAIRDNDKPASDMGKDELQIYRPHVQQKSGNGKGPVPSKVMKLSEVKKGSGKESEKKNQPEDKKPKENE